MDNISVQNDGGRLVRGYCFFRHLRPTPAIDARSISQRRVSERVRLGGEMSLGPSGIGLCVTDLKTLGFTKFFKYYYYYCYRCQQHY